MDIGVFLGVETHETEHASMLRLEHRLLDHFARRSPDVEGSHGQLGSGLSNRLGRDHADRLPLLNDSAPCQITSVTSRADAPSRLTGQNGPDLHPIHPSLHDSLRPLFSTLLLPLNVNSPRQGIP